MLSIIIRIVKHDNKVVKDRLVLNGLEKITYRLTSAWLRDILTVIITCLCSVRKFSIDRNHKI